MGKEAREPGLARQTLIGTVLHQVCSKPNRWYEQWQCVVSSGQQLPPHKVNAKLSGVASITKQLIGVAGHLPLPLLCKSLQKVFVRFWCLIDYHAK